MSPGSPGLLRQDQDDCSGCSQGGVFTGAPEDLQTRDQAGAQARAQGGVRGRPQGGLHQVKNQPEEGQEAGCQEVVLRALRRIWTCIN